MKRFLERREEYVKALARLREALIEEENEIVIDGILHRFEFTFELAWKTMKDYLEYQGIVENIGSPRETIKLSFKYKIIEDGEGWIEMMLSRNSLSHIYDNSTSRQIYNNIKSKYIVLLNNFEEKLKNM